MIEDIGYSCDTSLKLVAATSLIMLLNVVIALNT